MYHRILIATDGSELAAKAVDHGISLAKIHDASVLVVTVTEAWSSFDLARSARHGNQNPIAQYEEMAISAASNILEKAGRAAKSKGVSCELLHVQDRLHRRLIGAHIHVLALFGLLAIREAGRGSRAAAAELSRGR